MYAGIRSRLLFQIALIDQIAENVPPVLGTRADIVDGGDIRLQRVCKCLFCLPALRKERFALAGALDRRPNAAAGNAAAKLWMLQQRGTGQGDLQRAAREFR